MRHARRLICSPIGQRVWSHLGVIEKAIEEGNALEGMPPPFAETLVSLLDSAAGRTFLEHRVLPGAVEYFLHNDDVDSDFASDHGLADHPRVVITICNALGRDDLVTRLAIILP